MFLRTALAAAALAAFVLPAASGTVSTPNLAGGLNSMLAPPSAPVIVGGVGSGPAPSGAAPAPGGSAFVSGFINAYGGGGGDTGGGARVAPTTQGQ